MRIRLIVAVLVILLAISACNGGGYVLVSIPPKSGMLPIGSTRIVCVATEDSKWHPYIARITDYVVWGYVNRPPEYRVEIVGTPWWFIVNRETLDGNAC